MTDVRCVYRINAAIGEGPVWCPRESALYWVNIPAGAIHRFDPATGADAVFCVGRRLGSFALRESGAMVVAADDGFAFFDPRTGAFEELDQVEAHMPQNRFNDGKCDSRGRFWAGSMAGDYLNAPAPSGSLYRLDPDLTVTRVETGVTISNGLGWSPDDATMYYADTGARTLYAYDFDAAAGRIENRRAFVTVAPEDGEPDGIAVDAEGFVWCALSGGGRIARYDPDGRTERQVALPVPLPTSLAFGGDELDVLYVTSMSYELSAAGFAAAPLSGSLFAMEAPAPGLAVPRFAG